MAIEFENAELRDKKAYFKRIHTDLREEDAYLEREHANLEAELVVARASVDTVRPSDEEPVYVSVDSFTIQHPASTSRGTNRSRFRVARPPLTDARHVNSSTFAINVFQSETLLAVARTM